MSIKIYQSVSELPTRNGSISFPLSIYWDFGRRGEGRHLYGTITIEVLIWTFLIEHREYSP